MGDRRRATFRVEAIHPSLNVWSRQHPQKVARMKQEFGWFVRAAVQNAIVSGTWDGQIFDRAVVHIIHHFGDRRRHDPSNYTPKFLEDPLVVLGVLRDDDFRHITLSLEEGTVAKPPWTEVVITEDGEAPSLPAP